MGPWGYRAGGSWLWRSVSQGYWSLLATRGEELGEGLCGREMQSWPLLRNTETEPVTRLPSKPRLLLLFIYKGKCCPCGGAPECFAEMERAQPSLERSLFFSPGHTCGCQAAEDSNTDNGYLMTGLMQIKPEYALSVPSGFALKLAVNGAGRLV